MSDSVESLKERVRELEDVIYCIDFTCRAAMTATEAVRLIERLCASVNVEAVAWGRRVNGWVRAESASPYAYTRQGERGDVIQ